MWTSISLLLLLIYIIYRRRQNKSNDGEQTFEENIPIREPSEYRLSAVRALPTIAEENPAALSPSNSNHHFPPLSTSTNTTTSLVLGKITTY
jgi:hypothetical protein